MMQVFNQNLIEEAVSKTVSSENASFPATNIYDLERRRMTWRSAGYWLVASGSNTIVFREVNAGADLTATIAAGAYATDALFLAAVAAAMNAASTHTSTYTATRNPSTGKIILTQSAAGTASVFQLRWLTAAAFGTILGFDTSANDTGSTAYTADELRIHTEEFFIFDFGAPVNPTGIIAVSDRNIPLNISPTATVTIMANPSNSWSAPAESFTVTVRDFLLGYLNPAGIAALAGGYRYWKLQIIDNDNPDLYVELGAIVVATHIALDRGAPAFPYASKPVDNSIVDFSETGQAWVGKKPKTRIHTIQWEKLTNDDMEALEQAWEEKSKAISFFIALDPDSHFTTDGIRRTVLVKFQEEPESRLVSPGNWSSQWVIREEL